MVRGRILRIKEMQCHVAAKLVIVLMTDDASVLSTKPSAIHIAIQRMDRIIVKIVYNDYTNLNKKTISHCQVTFLRAMI